MTQVNSSNLKTLLEMYGVALGEWGVGQAKNVSDLNDEILGGEIHLRINSKGIARVVEIVKIYLRDPTNPSRGVLKQLFEILPDGRKKERNNHPSGMMKAGESPESTLERELEEELGLKPGEYSYKNLTIRVEARSSKSYPGIPCEYIIHPFEVTPSPGSSVLDEEFETVEKDGTTLHFKWVAE